MTTSRSAARPRHGLLLGGPRRALFGALLLLGGLGSLGTMGCAPAPTAPTAGSPAPAAGPADPGSSATAPARAPQRLIALAPAITEALFVLGAGSRVVGVGTYTSWPPEALALPRLGGLFDPNLEAIVALQPDLVVLAPSQTLLAERLAGLDIATLTVTTESVADVEAMFATLAARCELDATSALTALRTGLAPRDPALDVSVALVVSRQPGQLGELMLAGPGTYFADLLDRLGARNTFADAAMRYPTVSPEELLRRDPDVLVELHPDDLSPADLAAFESRIVAEWSTFATLSAVRRGRVRVVSGAHTMLPGPRLPTLYADLARALAP